MTAAPARSSHGVARSRTALEVSDARTAGTSRRAAPATDGEDGRPTAGPGRW